MRIVDVCAFYTPHGGGVKTYVERKLAAGVAAGHEMVLIVPGEADVVEERFPGARVIHLASPLLPLDRRYRYFRDEAALHRTLSEVDPDFVEASSPWSSAAMVGRWRGDTPRALVMHADPLSAYAYRWFGGVASVDTIDRGFARFWNHLRRLDGAFDLIVSASADFTSRLAAGGVTGAMTIPMGVEPGIFSPALRDEELRASMLARCGLSGEATLLLGVGRYAPEKRWGLVIDAAHAAGASQPVGLVLVGNGRGRRAVTARAAGSPHILVGTAIRDRTEMARTMASADALVHGCEAETFCMVAAEARASGLPLIVPDRGGAADQAARPPHRRYRAADGASLRDEIIGFCAQRGSRPHPALPDPDMPDEVRTMDEHFAELFATYAAITRTQRLVA